MSTLYVNTIAPQSGTDVNLSGSVKVTGNLEVTGTLHAKTTDFIVSANSTTFGDAATDSLTFNASTGSVPNGFNFDSNTLVIDSSNNRIGIGVAAPTTTLDVNGTVKATTFSGGSFSATADLTVGDDLMLQSDSAVLNFGADDDVSLTHTADTGLHLNAGMKLAFRDQGGEYVYSVSDGNLGVVAATSIDLKSPQIDIGEDDTSDVTINLLGSTNDMAIVYDESAKKLSFDSTDLVVDGANDRVGIGTSAPSAQLDVHDTTTGTANTGGKIRVSANDGAAMGDSHRLGVIEFTGAEDSSNTQIIGARIEALTDGAWTNVNNPAALYFYVNKGDNTAPLALKLDNNRKATFSGEVVATSLDISGDVATDGKLALGVDADADDTTADSATGRLSAGAGEDLNLYHGGTNSYVVNTTGDLIIATEGGSGAGIILDAEDDTVEIKYSGVLGATFDGDGLDLVTGDAYQINGASVLNATTLGSSVVNSSLTSVGTLTTLTVDNITINGTEIDSDSDLTVDVAGDIALSADGGNVTMDDGTVTVFDFDVDNVLLKVMDDADTGDYFSIGVATNGATTLTTVDDDGAAANLIITADGTVDIDSAGTMTLDSGANINLEPAAGSHILLDGTIQVDAGVVTGATSVTVGTTVITDDSIVMTPSTDDTATIAAATNGALTITTVDTAAAAADLTFTIDGDIIMTPAGGNVKVTGTNPKLTIGDADAEDTMLVFDGNAQDYRIGLDDGTDTLEIGHGTSHGTNTAITINSSGEITKLNIPAAAVAQASDHIIFLDGGATGAPKAESIDDFLTAIAGSGVSVSSSQLTVSGGSGAGVGSANVFTEAQTVSKDTDGELVGLVLKNESDANDTSGIVSMRFDLEDTGGNAVDSGKIAIKKAQAFTSTASTQDSDMVLSTSFNGTLTEQVTIESTGNVNFNDDKALAWGGGTGRPSIKGNKSSQSIIITADTSTFASGNADDPLVEIKNTANDATGARLRFVKDKGAAGAANDVAGVIEFYADDANQDQVLFAEMKADVAVHTNGQEGGRLTLSVASHDGEKVAGLILSDGSAEDEIDVSIGNGTASQTTIAGDLIIEGDQLKVTQYIEHDGDADTRMVFGNDNISFEAGGVALFKLEEAGQDSVIVNEPGNDVDFRVETANETHMIFVEGSTNRVSIGDSTNSPAATLEITNHASAGAFDVPLLQLNNNDVDQVAIDINAANTTANIIDITADDVLTSGKVLHIDVNDAATSAVTPTYMHFDFDKDGVTGDGVTSTYTALDIDLNDGATNHANANVTMTGLDIDIASTNAQGTLLNVGAAINVSGADTNIALQLENTVNDDSPAELRFIKDKGAAGSDDDGAGIIKFFADNDAQEQIEVVRIQTSIAEASDGEEGGEFNVGVATHNGSIALGLTIKDGDTSGELDVTLAAGPDSVTTVSGDIVVTTTTTYTPSGTNNFTGDDANAAIPITKTYVKIDANGSARTGMRFSGAGAAGQILYVENVGGENVTFDSSAGTAKITTSVSTDTIVPGAVHHFVSNGVAWFLIGPPLAAG